MSSDQRRDVAFDPATALTRLLTKRGLHRRRHQLIGAAAVLAMLSSTAVVWRAGAGPQDAPNVVADVTVTSSADRGDNRGFTAAGCAFDPLAKDLANARAAGASVITGRGALTRRTVKDSSGVRYEMTLTDMRTLAGPVLPDGTVVWILASPRSAGSTVETAQGPLWGPAGALFGVYYPPHERRNSMTFFRQAPVVDDQVILSASGCWSPKGLPGEPFHGPLTEIPGTDAYNGAAREQFGFTAVPLTTLERLAKSEQR